MTEISIRNRSGTEKIKINVANNRNNVRLVRDFIIQPNGTFVEYIDDETIVSVSSYKD